MANIQIAIFNRSTAVNDAQVQGAVNDLQVQVHRDFAPIWGIDADLTFVPTGALPPPGMWQIGVFDSSDQAGALGYHDITSEGLPLGKAFAGSDIQVGASWTVTLSHELLEMLGDPDINLTALNQDPNTGAMILYAYEVCDAVEADNLGYLINNTSVSDFVYPSWFESFWQLGATQFDFMHAVNAPFQLAPGGYIGYMNITSQSGWQQQTADLGPSPYLNRARLGSRREKRKITRAHWLKSLI